MRKIIHRAELLAESDYTIVQRYQSILRGLHDYYCMASNVSKRMSHLSRILQISLSKTLASKHKTSIGRVQKKYRVPNQEYKTYRVTITRPRNVRYAEARRRSRCTTSASYRRKNPPSLQGMP